MIQSNLLFACLVSMAVGGNTATAFNNTPKKATSETETTITESYNVNIGTIRTEISNLTELDNNGHVERVRKVNRYILSENNYLIQGNTYSYDESWTDRQIEDEEEYETSMNITILRCDPYYNVKLDNSTFTFLAQAYWQSYALNAYTEWELGAKAIIYNANTNLDQYIGLNAMTKNEERALYTTIKQFNSNYVLDTDFDSNISFIDENEQGEPQWAEDPITLHIDQYNLNARTPFYLVLYSRVLTYGLDNGYPVFANYGSYIQNPTGMLNFNETWTTGGQQGNITQEVVPLIPLMYTILTLPFTFITSAFNLTIFQGTPYQVNIGNIVVIIFEALILLFIIKIIMKIWK